MKKRSKKHGKHMLKKKRVRNTMVEVTDFNNTYQDSQILGVSVLVDSSDHKCIGDIHNIDVVDWCILDNARGTRLVWRRLTLQCKSRRFFCRVLLHHLQ